MKWFKFYGQDYLSDPKVLALTACERSCWITILAYASVNDNGEITYLSEEQLMIQAGVSPMHDEWGTTQGVLEKFKKLQMITLDNEVITVLNWQKRQETNLTSYERVKRYREKKRNDNVNDNDRVEENRIDKNNTVSKIGILPLTVEKESSKEEKPLKEKKDTSYRAIFSLWGKDYPLNWNKNLTEIEAAKNLLQESSLEDVKWFLGVYEKYKAIPYCPTILKPSDVDRKWENLLAFKKKHG